MSALARYFHAKGVKVSGYDKTPSPLTKELESSGITIHYEEDMALAPKEADVVVYTPAIPASHSELIYYKENGYSVVKRSDVLQWITENAFNICVGGTHGKTTVTTMIAHLLRHTGYGCNAFLGGISANYQTNFWSSSNPTVVVEADEYDRSFLKLVPDIAVITAMDADHLDIYGTPLALEDAFIQFAGQVKPGGLLVCKYGLDRENELKASQKYTYSLSNTDADVHAAEVRVENGSYRFDVLHSDWQLRDLHLYMGGLHNIENCIAAVTVVKHLGIRDDLIREAVAAFRGVHRRFELALATDQHIVIDDYAHHPEELRALISGVRSIYPDKKLLLLFQPHLFSRTKDLADGFAESLDLADEVMLMPIYPARELPVEGVNSLLIAGKMKKVPVTVMDRQDILKEIERRQPELVVIAGAGDIDRLVQPVAIILGGKG